MAQCTLSTVSRLMARTNSVSFILFGTPPPPLVSFRSVPNITVAAFTHRRVRHKLRVFASHDWGRGASTHARVRDAVAALRARDLDVWFDETHMTGNILDAMCAGIEDADVVVVFVTRNYMEKVEHGPDTDNVRREFMFAAARPEKLVAVRFDADLPPMWSGPVRMVLGSRLYVDLTTPELGTRDIDRLTAAIRNVVPSTPRVLRGGAPRRSRAMSVLHCARASIASPRRSGTNTVRKFTCATSCTPSCAPSSDPRPSEMRRCATWSPDWSARWVWRDPPPLVASRRASRQSRLRETRVTTGRKEGGERR